MGTHDSTPGSLQDTYRLSKGCCCRCQKGPHITLGACRGWAAVTATGRGHGREAAAIKRALTPSNGQTLGFQGAYPWGAGGGRDAPRGHLCVRPGHKAGDGEYEVEAVEAEREDEERTGTAREVIHRGL